MNSAKTTGGKRSWRRRLLLLLGGLLLPIAALLALELGLRAAGYGFPTGFFILDSSGGEPAYVENHQFGLRFFPPALNRHPLTQRVLIDKKGAIRIFVLGGSAALGDPEPLFGFSRMLDVLLSVAYPERRFEVKNVAMTSISSHVVLPIAESLIDKEGDLWVVYAGNNEVVGPFGCGSVFSKGTPALWRIRLGLALKTTRVGQLLDALRWRFRLDEQPGGWKGMEMFLEHQVLRDDPGLQRVRENLRANLRDILDAARRADAYTILSTVAVNLKDSPPFASAHGARVGPAEMQRIEELIEAAELEESSGRFPGAESLYRTALGIDGEYAELHFRLGKSLENQGRSEEAGVAYTQAMELDTLRFRADGRINAVLREVAGGGGDRVRLFDAEKVLRQSSPDRLPGQQLFCEHVHFTFRGNYLLAIGMAEQVRSVLFPSEPAPVWIDQDEVARRLGYTDWSECRILRFLIDRLGHPPFSNQLGHEEREAMLEARLEERTPKDPREAASGVETIMRAAIESRPADPELRRLLALFLVDTGAYSKAIVEWEHVIRLLPHDEDAHDQVGHLYATYVPNGAVTAEEHLRKAVLLRPEFFEAHTNLGWALAMQGRLDEAVREYRKAIELKPGFTLAHNNLGLALARLGRETDARAEFERALEINPNHLYSHLNLGNLLLEQGDRDKALGHFAEAARINPRFFPARLKHGTLLAETGRLKEAAAELNAALRLNDQSTEARKALAAVEKKLGESGR
ncbi:MAG: tetratricopeptide repeat protein [Planctomycetota bacterium]